MDKDRQNEINQYLEFLAMIITSMVLMYGLTYLNSSQIFEHAWFSETRLFMTLMMGGSMAIVMLAFMLGMYRNARLNTAIFLGAILLIGSAIWLVRSQATVTGVDYMEGMIPHHSIAILTSERADIDDLRVRELADDIIAAQRREIREMEWLINDIRENGVVVTQQGANDRPVPDFYGSSD
jgi:hypothetical protein